MDGPSGFVGLANNRVLPSELNPSDRIARLLAKPEFDAVDASVRALQVSAFQLW
jgi:hypothetical protein